MIIESMKSFPSIYTISMGNNEVRESTEPANAVPTGPTSTASHAMRSSSEMGQRLRMDSAVGMNELNSVSSRFDVLDAILIFGSTFRLNSSENGAEFELRAAGETGNRLIRLVYSYSTLIAVLTAVLRNCV